MDKQVLQIDKRVLRVNSEQTSTTSGRRVLQVTRQVVPQRNEY